MGNSFSKSQDTKSTYKELKRKNERVIINLLHTSFYAPIDEIYTILAQKNSTDPLFNKLVQLIPSIIYKSFLEKIKETPKSDMEIADSFVDRSASVFLAELEKYPTSALANYLIAIINENSLSLHKQDYFLAVKHYQIAAKNGFYLADYALAELLPKANPELRQSIYEHWEEQQYSLTLSKDKITESSLTEAVIAVNKNEIFFELIKANTEKLIRKNNLLIELYTERFIAEMMDIAGFDIENISANFITTTAPILNQIFENLQTSYLILDAIEPKKNGPLTKKQSTLEIKSFKSYIQYTNILLLYQMPEIIPTMQQFINVFKHNTHHKSWPKLELASVQEYIGNWLEKAKDTEKAKTWYLKASLNGSVTAHKKLIKLQPIGEKSFEMKSPTSSFF